MMSNALLPLAGAQILADTATHQAAFSDPSGTIAAIGLVVLTVWLFVRAARPGKLSLRGSPGRPNRVDPAVFLLLLVGWVLLDQLGGLAARWLAANAVPDTASRPDGPDARLIALAGILARPLQICLCLMVAAWTFRHGVFRGLGLTPRRWVLDSVRAGVALLAVWPVCIGMFVLILRIHPAWAQWKHPFFELAAKGPPLWRTMAWVSAVVMAPLAEEIFFRGMLQSMLRRVCASPWLAIILASALFGAIHFQQPGAVLPLVLLGVVLGYNYERTGRLWAPVLLHALFNATNLLIDIGV